MAKAKTEEGGDEIAEVERRTKAAAELAHLKVERKKRGEIVHEEDGMRLTIDRHRNRVRYESIE